MRFLLTDDPEEFAARARPLLESRLEFNLMAGVTQSARDGAYDQAHFALGLDHRDLAVTAALRTPPWPLLVGPLEPADARVLVARWLEHDPDLGAVNGPTAAARALAAAWCEATGGTSEPGMRQAMHALREVSGPPRPAAGRLRPAREQELELVASWWGAFVREAGVVGGQRDSVLRERIARGWIHLWEHSAPVSLVAIAAEVAGVARIGPVYTPPRHRSRGYAGSAVAALSRLALRRGAHTCMLYTDLANPTSNKIYGEIGYRRISEWEEWRLMRPPA